MRTSLPPSPSAVLIRPSRTCIRGPVRDLLSILHTHTTHSPAASHFFFFFVFSFFHKKSSNKNEEGGVNQGAAVVCRHLNRMCVCTLHLLAGRQCRPRHLTGRLSLAAVAETGGDNLLLLPVRRAASGPARTREDHRKRRGWNHLVGCWC